MSLKTLDALHRLAKEVVDYRWGVEFDRAIDELEAEVAERFIPLPVDADGVVIKPGDTLAVKGKAHRIENVALYRASNGCWAIGAHRPDELVHFKPRTIEDVLLDAGVSRACVEDVAAELRELMGGAE